jgi:hypothetical protein
VGISRLLKGTPRAVPDSARVRSRPGGGRVGPRDVHGPYLQKSRQNLKTRQRLANRQNKGKRKSTYQRADGEHGERPECHVIVPAGPKVDGASRPGGRVLPREEVR